MTKERGAVEKNAVLVALGKGGMANRTKLAEDGKNWGDMGQERGVGADGMRKGLLGAALANFPE